MKSSASASYKYTGWLLVLFAVLILPVSGFLPDWVNFENGPIENTQVILLLGCALMCVKFARDTLSSPSHKMWLPSAGIFLILAARELSWGRVFFIKEYSAAGEPILIASSEMPFRTAIHGFIGVLAVLCLYGLIRFVPWKRIFRNLFPVDSPDCHHCLRDRRHGGRSSRDLPHSS